MTAFRCQRLSSFGSSLYIGSSAGRAAALELDAVSVNDLRSNGVIETLMLPRLTFKTSACFVIGRSCSRYPDRCLDHFDSRRIAVHSFNSGAGNDRQFAHLYAGLAIARHNAWLHDDSLACPERDPSALDDTDTMSC